MEGLSIIEGKELQHLKERLINIEQTQLAVIKLIQQLVPSPIQNNVPGFISIQDACEKYKTSHVNINNKIKQFRIIRGREIDRLQSGSYKLINEAELQEALRLKRTLTVVFKKVA
jgi:hypothetical protein